MTQTLDIYGPIDQAARCIDAWLAEERRWLPKPLKTRAAALMARYFLHEQEPTDTLMMSFLRHYSGLGAVDLDDISNVKRELKAVLDKSTHLDDRAPLPLPRQRLATVFAAGVIMAVLAVGCWHLSGKKITREQQTQLKLMVEEITVRKGVSHVSVWAKIKGPLDVRSYQEISWWHYDEAQDILKKMVKTP